METLDAERYPTHGPVGKNKDHFFNQSRNDSAFESLLGSVVNLTATVTLISTKTLLWLTKERNK